MKFAVLHARTSVRELLRYPAYVVPTLLFPAVFFVFFVVPGAGGLATVKMAAFAGFATIGVAFFQFGVGIATERISPWEAYVRTLPVSTGSRLAARLLSAAAFAIAAAGVLITVALASTDASLPARGWVDLAAVLLLGTIPFALLGIALGYWAPARGALPIANLLYLGLSYAGGLWIRPSSLPRGVEHLSRFLPTRSFADILTAVVYGNPWAPRRWIYLFAFSVAFGLFAAAGYRRDEGKRFR